MALLGVKKNLSSNSTLLYSKEPARLHDSNEANDNLIRVQGAEKSSRECKILTVWFGLSNLGTLGTISQLPELRLNYRLLRWNRGAEPVLLSIITLNLKTNFC